LNLTIGTDPGTKTINSPKINIISDKVNEGTQ